MGTQLGKQGRLLRRWDGGGGVVPIGGGGEAAGRRLPREIAAHRMFIGREAPGGLGATEGACDRSDNAFT